MTPADDQIWRDSVAHCVIPVVAPGCEIIKMAIIVAVFLFIIQGIRVRNGTRPFRINIDSHMVLINLTERFQSRLDNHCSAEYKCRQPNGIIFVSTQTVYLELRIRMRNFLEICSRSWQECQET